MRFGVLGTGIVGRTIGAKLVALGHEVTLGARERGNEAAAAWVGEVGGAAAAGSFADAAAAAEVLVNATNGAHAIEALQACGESGLAGKVVLDVTNALDMSRGFPPRIGASSDDSLGEQIQRAFPHARVVKTLNTMNCDVMVDPSLAPGGVVFISGNDEPAKRQAAAMLTEFGWRHQDIVDLGDITAARGLEMYVELWLRLMRALGTGRFNISVVRSG